MNKENFTYRIKGGESRTEPGRAVWFFMYNDYYREWPASSGNFFKDVNLDEAYNEIIEAGVIQDGL